MNAGAPIDRIFIPESADISTQNRTGLDTGWKFVGVAPGSVETPLEILHQKNLQWLPAVVPGTVASSLRALGHYSGYDEIDFDSQDYWYRCTFSYCIKTNCAYHMYFGGLATLADVWLNGELILSSDNMFLGRSCEVTDQLLASDEGFNELWIRFGSLTEAFSAKHARAQWRTGLVSHRNLRLYRTTLLGRMPGICPAIAPVGPWRDIEIVEEHLLRITDVALQTRLEENQGVVKVSFSAFETIENGLADVDTAKFYVGENVSDLSIERISPNEIEIAGELNIPNPKLWWPHTHGEPHRYAAFVKLATQSEEIIIRVPSIGFRTVELEGPPGSEFRFLVNGVPIFCRGSCWSPVDLMSLAASETELRQALEVARNAGMNMLRVSGSMVYESNEFYALCDEFGILVWQDFMFARMDYPFEDSNFTVNAEAEARFQLTRLGHRPAICVLCGNSEVQQQAAMLGLPESFWCNDWFDIRLPELCHDYRSDVPYWPSSPSGGVMPFYTDSGVSHYFGVGGYRRPILDAQVSEPGFATECLAFSIFPEPESIESTPDEGRSPKFKAGVPKDAGANWDFADVTDHYTGEIFGIDPQSLKRQDEERYQRVARAAVGEIMAIVQAMWRRKGSRCRGALVWLHRDFFHGAGWGLIDCDGIPKAPYYYLKRVWSPLALLVLDDGLNGLRIHLANDSSASYQGRLKIRFVRFDGTTVETAECDVNCQARATTEISVESITGMFMDSSYSYRFGNRNFDFLVAQLYQHSLLESQSDNLLVESLYLPQSAGLLPAEDIDLRVELVGGRDDLSYLQVSCSKFAQTVSLSAPGYRLSDNYFHLAPHEPRTITLKPYKSGLEGVGFAQALNSDRRTGFNMAGPDIYPNTEMANSP